MQEVVDMITQIGFPIAMCLICMYYIAKKDEVNREEIAKVRKENSEDIAQLRDAHKEEVTQLREALDNNTNVMQNNTLVMQRLIDKMEDDVK